MSETPSLGRNGSPQRPGKDSESCKLERLHHHEHTTAEVARTISLSFSDDPLVAWVRHGARDTWGALDQAVQRWQEDRVRQTMLEGLVLRLRQQNETTSKSESPSPPPSEGDLGAVAMIWPPKTKLQQSWGQYLEARWLSLTRYFYPIEDPGADKKRLHQMMKTHHANLARLSQSYLPKKVWYLEVVAVHPSQQGRGLGTRLLNAICNMFEIGTDVIILESTSPESKRLYEKCGFKVVEEVVLEDAEQGDEVGGRVQMWLMARQGGT